MHDSPLASVSGASFFLMPDRPDLRTPTPAALAYLSGAAAVLVDRQSRGRERVSREDLLQAARIALFQAERRWDPQTGTRFNTYATGRMLIAIRETQRTWDGIPRSAWAKLKSGCLTHANLFPVSFDAEPEEAFAVSDPDPSPETQALDRISRAELWKVVQWLPERERCAVILHFADGKSYPQVGEALGVGSAWARQIALSGLERLRGFLAEKSPSAVAG